MAVRGTTAVPLRKAVHVRTHIHVLESLSSVAGEESGLDSFGVGNSMESQHGGIATLSLSLTSGLAHALSSSALAPADFAVVDIVASSSGVEVPDVHLL